MEYGSLVKEIFAQRETPPLCHVRSYGCQQNVNDGERIAGLLCELGCAVTDDITLADVIILNTCAVRESAEMRVYGNIGELKHLKEQNPSLIIGLCGCMAQEPQTAERIRASYRYVDIIFGTFALKELPRLLYETLTRKGLAVDISERENECPEDIPLVRTDSFKAGVSIMYGCNNFCSYCIVPYVRGRERSRVPERILDEIGELSRNGCKEIMLLGQNVNSYGKGTKENLNFPELLRRIDRTEGDFRVRFMSPHPKDATKELFDVMAQSRKLCRSIHLPLQSGSDRILKAMNRGYTAEKYLDIVNYARSVMPGLSVTTDIIVGFPGETEADFEQTLGIMKSVKFDNIFSFIYSPRKGTKAALMDDPVTYGEKAERMNRLLGLQREITTESYKRFLGRELFVLFDSTYKDGSVCGKSDENINVLVKNDELLIGTMRRVRVTETKGWAVIGEVLP